MKSLLFYSVAAMAPSDLMGGIGAMLGGSAPEVVNPADHPNTAGTASAIANAAADIAANPSTENIIEEVTKAGLKVGAMQVSRVSPAIGAILDDFGPLVVPAIVSALGALFNASGIERPALFADLHDKLADARKHDDSATA